MKTEKRFAYLLSEVLKIHSQNEEMSLFDLADSLDISYLALSDIFFKRKKPSIESMEYIFSKLGERGLLSHSCLDFQDLVEEVGEALIIIRNIENRSQWLAFAVLELKRFGIKDEKISNRLCVSKVKIDSILRSLETLSLV